MAVYVYDNTQIDPFVTEDRGLVTASVTETFNGGNITDVPDNDNDANNFNPHYYGEIRYLGDVLPFGDLKVNGGDVVTIYVPHVPGTGLFEFQDVAEVSYRTIWHGSGSLFEIGGGLERVAQPDLGAAGPSPRIYGGSEVPVRTYSEVGSGTLALSDNAATFKYNVYPYSASGTLSISGYNSQLYPDDYIPVTRNLIKLKIGKEGSKEAYVWHYRLQGNEVFDLEDYGFITSLEGSDFSNVDLSFDKTITKAKDRSFSDSDQLEFADYGVITETVRQVTVTRTIFPDELATLYNGQFFRTYVANSGTGIGEGGFNIGRHIKFGNASNYRYVEFTLDTSNSPDIALDIIRGNFSNGGERPDTNEDLYLQYWNGTSWTTIPGNSPSIGNGPLVAWYDSTFDSLKTTTVTLPVAAKNVNQRLRLYQNYSTGPNWDQYGITQIVHNVVEIQPLESQDDGVLERKLGGGLFAHAYQATGTAAADKIIYNYDTEIGSGSILFELTTTDPEIRTFSHEASGGFNVSGQNWFSQAPQSRVFGLEGEVSISGASEERFIPATAEGTGLFDITGSAEERIISQAGERKPLLRPTGFGGATLTKQSPSQTARLVLSGELPPVNVTYASDTTELFQISGESAGPRDTIFVAHFRSALESANETPEDFGFISQVHSDYEDWGYVRETAKSAYNWGWLLSEFNYIQVGGQHFPSINTLSVTPSSLIVQTLGTTGVATFTLSDQGLPEKTFQYVTSGITGIATYKAGINIFGYNWFSQAPQSTIFGLEGEFTLSGVGNESFTPTTYIASGTFSAISGSAQVERKTDSPDTVGNVYLGGNGDTSYIPSVIATGGLTLSQGREEGQTYLRIIAHAEDAFKGDLNIRGSATDEKVTISYNDSSIWYDDIDVDYGFIGNIPSYGFDLEFTGGSSTAETYDDETNTFDQEIIYSAGGLTYDQGLSTKVLPSFDNTDSYEVDFTSIVNSEDYGTINDGLPIVGGPNYDQYLYPHYTGFVDQDINKGYDDAGWINESAVEPSRYPFGKLTIAQPGFANISRVIPNYPGLGTLTVTGISTAVEKFVTGDSSTQLFAIGGSGAEAYLAQTPENTVLFEYSSGIESEKATFSEVGIGTVSISGTCVEKATFDEVFSGILTFSGAAIERTSMDPPEGTYLHIVGGAYTDLRVSFDPPVTKATMRLIGALDHPDIDYTPHYGIERNIGIETGFTLLPGSSPGEYGDPGIVTTRFLPKYPASGLITFPPLRSISRTNAPILTEGTIYIVGVRTDGPDVGAGERFVPATEFAGPGLLQFKGIGTTRPVRVYGYYGDDRDPGTSGTISIRTEKNLTLERNIFREIGSGSATFSGAATDERTTFSEIGGGSLFKLSSLVERTTFREVFGGTATISGSATESFIAQTPENTQLFSISGAAKKSLILKTDFTGVISLASSFDPFTGRTIVDFGGGSLNILSGAAESITIPSITSTSLFNTSGVALTREIQVYGYYGDDKDPGTSGSMSLYGEVVHPDLSFTPAITGSGTATFSGDATVSINLVSPAGGVTRLSGSAAKRFTRGDGSDTILFKIGGSANTAPIQVFGYYGDDRDPGTSGTLTILGASEDREIAVYGYYGDDRDPGTSGQITISGRPLVHPEVQYIPAITGTGLFKILGIAQPARVFPPVVGFGTLFNLSSGNEAYARSTYIAVGIANFYSAAQTEILRFEEGRTYVVII